MSKDDQFCYINHRTGEYDRRHYHAWTQNCQGGKMIISDIRDRIYTPIPLPQVERDSILNALACYSGNQTKAARSLGITLRVMRYKMGTHGIPGMERPVKQGRKSWAKSLNYGVSS